MSDAEEALATLVRWAGLPEPEREVPLIESRRFRFDFVWREHLLAVEVDGGVWVGGQHTTGQGFESDCEKGNLATLLGYAVLRVTPGMIKDGRALAWIERALEMRRENAHGHD